MIILFLLMNLITAAHAEPCAYNLNQESVRIVDRSVFFGSYLKQTLARHGYQPAKPGETAENTINVAYASVQHNRFEHAHAQLTWVTPLGNSFTLDGDVRCYTQSCTAKDGSKAIRKAIDQLDEVLLDECKNFN